VKQGYPSELDGPLPRKVRMNSTNGSSVLVLVLLSLVSGSVICGFACSGAFGQMQRRAALRRDGRDIAGRVTATHAGHGDATVSYTFTVNGSIYFGKAQMPDYRLILHESDGIAVRYLPINPAINHPADWEWSGLTDFVPDVFALFFATMGIVGLVFLLRNRKLAREGRAAEGLVTSCAPNKRQYRVDYEFSTEDGARMKGRCDCSEQFEAGACIWIIYLPKRPRRNHSYPLELFDVVYD